MPTSELTQQHWSSPAFEAELRAWVEPLLGPVRLERHKLRPWSTVWRVYAGTGLFWAKQNCAANRFEARLLVLLSELVPDHVVAPLAIDADRGLVLSPDQGDVLGPAADDVEAWCGLVQRWALVQRVLVDRTDDLLRLGVARLDPVESVSVALARARWLNALPAGDSRRLSDAQRHRIEASLPDLTDAAARVAELGLPLTLNHNDLHGGNVFASGRFFDLADALLCEPMAALHVPLSDRGGSLGYVREDARLWRVVDAWAEVWADLVTPSRLRDVLPHAMRLARVARAEAWFRVIGNLDPDDVGELGPACAAWLETLPEAGLG